VFSAAAIAVAGSLASASAAAGAPSAPTPTFIEALAAIPDATRALTAAELAVEEAGVQRAATRAAAIAAEAELSRANQDAREVRLVRTLADRAAQRARDAIDDAARTMYSTGGTVPTLAEVLMTADSQTGFTRSLQTRQYLSSVASDVIRLAESADAQRRQADTVAVVVHEARDRTSAAARVAESTLAEADAALGAARAEEAEARGQYRQLMRITRVDRSADYGRIKQCGDWLTKLLARTGFEGENLREAWAIVMRESGGRADAVSVTNDLGLFQINTATWRKQPWFDRETLLTKRYNATVAHTLSRGGRTWYSWGLDGHGRPDARAYVNAGWSEERIVRSIVMPYVQWYAQYPCRPAYERDLGLGIPERPLADEGKDDPALQEGGGVRPSDDVGLPTVVDEPVVADEPVLGEPVMDEPAVIIDPTGEPGP
jgi:hypothetical protein